jgi:hypothetical protein
MANSTFGCLIIFFLFSSFELTTMLLTILRDLVPKKTTLIIKNSTKMNDYLVLSINSLL